jgi:hypothetical protein
MIVEFNNQSTQIDGIAYDDTVAMLYHKVARTLDISYKDIMLTCWAPINKPVDAWVHHFVKDMFNKTDMVTFEEFNNYVTNRIKFKNNALRSFPILKLENAVISIIDAEPTHYKLDITNANSLVNEFPAKIKCTLLEKSNSIGMRQIKREPTINVNDVDKFSQVKHSIVLWHYRFTALPSEHRQIELNEVFNSLSMSYEVPFAKFIKANKNISVKVNSIFASETNTSTLKLWSKSNKSYYANAYKDLIVLRVPSDDGTAITLILYNEGHIDIKLNFNNCKKRIDSPMRYMERILPSIRNYLHMYNLSYILYSGTVKNIKVRGSLNLSKLFTQDDIKNRINQEVFSYIKFEKDYSVLLFKKTSGFYNTNNIQSVLQMLSISKLGNNTYDIFPELQAAEIKDAFQMKELTYHRNNIKNIIIKIKCGPNGLVFHADGIKNNDEIERLNKYIEHIFFSLKTDLPPPPPAKKQSDNMFENSFFDDSDDEDENREEVDEIENTNQNSKDFQMSKIVDCPPPPQLASSSAKKDILVEKKKSYDRTLLQALQAADPVLFDSTSSADGKKTFARKCQSSRQPNVMNAADLNRNLKCFPQAMKNHINGYGTTDTMQKENYYACAPIWCPKSRTAMSIEDFKKYNYKCPYPDIEEEPIKFLNPGDRAERVSVIENKYPCCYNLKKKTEEVLSNNESKTSNKYILNEAQQQLPPGRFGVIPESLNKLFDGQNCKQGSIQSSETDGYVRVGVRDTTQPFLDCLASCLDMNSHSDLVNKIINTITFLHFMSTNLFTYFVTGDTSYAKYKLFQKWFPKQTDYLDKFFIKDDIEILLTELALENVPTKSMSFYNEIRREYLFYTAFLRYIEYLNDEHIPKIPKLVLPLFKTLYDTINVVIIDSTDPDASYISCDSLYDYINKYVVIVQNRESYECINHIKSVKKHGLQITNLFFYETSPFIQRLTNDCECMHNSTYEDKIISFNRDTILLQVVDYDMQVIGIVCKLSKRKYVFYPFKKTRRIDINSATQVMFMDTFLEVGGSVTKEDYIETYYADINKRLGHKYYDTDKIKMVGNDDMFFIGKKINAPVPLKKIKREDNMYLHDLQILLGDVSDDKRIEQMRKDDYRYKTYILLLNEIISRRKDIYDDLEFIRHEANPLTYLQKFTYLKNLFEPILEQVVHISSLKKFMDITDDSLCTKQTNRNQCSAINYCSYILEDNSVASCKLNVHKGDYDYLIERCIDYVINPSNTITKRMSYPVHAKIYENILIHAIDDSSMEIQINAFKNNFKNDYRSSKTLSYETNYSSIVMKGVDNVPKTKLKMDIIPNVQLYEINSVSSLISSLYKLLGGHRETKIDNILNIPEFIPVNILVYTKSKSEVISSNEIIRNIYLVIYKTSGGEYYIAKKNDGRIIFRYLELTTYLNKIN